MIRVRSWGAVASAVAALATTAAAADTDPLSVDPSGDPTGVVDTAAVQRALDLAGQVGGTVRFGSGTFHIARPLTLTVARDTPLVRLVGQGRDATVLASVQEPTTLPDMTPVVRLDSSTKMGLPGPTIEMSGLAIDGRENGRVSDGIKAWGGTGLRLHDLAVRNLAVSATMPGVVGIRLGDTHDSVIENTHISHIAPDSRYAVGIQARSGSSDLDIVGSTVDHVGASGINCANEATAGSRNISVRGNTVTNAAMSGIGFGIELYRNCDDSTVEDNGRVDHGISAVESDRVAIRRNIVQGGEYGIETGGVGRGDIVVADNTTTRSTLGLVLQDTTHASVLRNRFVDSRTYGGWLKQNTRVHVSGSGCGDTRCGFVHSGSASGLCEVGLRPSAALYVERDRYLTLDGLTLAQPGGYGISFTGSDHGGSDFLSVVGNTFHDNDCGPISQWLAPTEVEWSVNEGATFPCAPPGAFDCRTIGDWQARPTPGAAIAVAPTVKAGQPVTYRVRAGADTVWQLIDLGVGSPRSAGAAETSGTVVFPKRGRYQVSVVVWDSYGRSGLTSTMVRVN
ncbi:right-handed parallel beta-helix repeat-containing protein [Actinokineospora xionganensis]|uniref:Right-handed parallel beta-helix repeat-containing protein n=1 Tax=Actinokineospora xionganensis TaxID=2684470 RepID=A0ABR7L6J3_9PSEU|nr:right-handed parallel beta-helix repeat-containing protein [Actinokineospora xionganensis]MBC6447996.1 right-handed parallel beta-helix repeat-containing protein [Actinokineospora xionganensis]